MSFNAALSGLKAASSNLDVIGNNIANASTTGFKSSRVEFADVYAVSQTGAAGNTVGSGVVLSSVSQQFSPGNVSFTESNLDLAISGSGFFVLSDNGTVAYTRAGAFGVDKNGYISNANGQRLHGLLADNTGTITGAEGELHISAGNLSPLATTNIAIQLNLDATAIPPATPFPTGFTSANPPPATSYTSTTATTIYDSLGNSHIMTSYFIKTSQPNQWQVHIAVDGTDVTPLAASVPGGSPPQPYAPGQVAAPFTLVFSENGVFIPNNPSAPPQYYGDSPVENSVGALINSGTMSTLDLGDLTINGAQIAAAKPSYDVFSTTDNAASALAVSVAINLSSNLHGVTATPVPAEVDLGTFTAGAIAAGELVINGQDVVGNPADVNALRNLINAQVSGVTASVDGSSHLILTAADGRNVQIKSTGGVAVATLSNFDMTGAALDKVQRGQISLSILNNQAIVVGGNSPTDVGFNAGILSGIYYTSSDVIDISAWDPATGADSPQDFSIDLGSSSQYGASFSVQALSQNGYSTGRFTSVDIDTSGIIFARYSNGESLRLGQVTLANFGDVQGLQPLGDSLWAETYASGPALVGKPGSSNLGMIQSGALESSNVQITNELVNLITAQRDFQANAQTIRADDAITQTIINLR